MKNDPSITADFVTLANGFLGLLAIMYIIDGNFRLGMLLILVAIIADGFDGILARFFRREAGHGVYLDSIADMVSFCFAPSILLYGVYYDLDKGTSFQSLDNALTVTASMLVVLFGILRLARFVEKGYKTKAYMGLPTPAAALFIVTLLAVVGNQFVVLGLSILISFLMISRIDYPKLRGILGWVAALVIVIGIMALFYPSDFSVYALAFSLAMASVYVVIGPYYEKWWKGE
ncbi:MAG: CDP-diacylglycerol--serine O-phosphatidyltransferase [Methanomassiliicoccales archaeon]|nr:MAG: CDP-diacylglycerol--serine O-phosphatidyltransferase [Methanomassiliicoccales archaeon]